MSDSKNQAVVPEVVESTSLVERNAEGIRVRRDQEVQATIDTSFDDEMAHLHTLEVAEQVGRRTARTFYGKLYLNRYKAAMKRLG